MTGDSQAEFLGQRLIDQAPKGLLDVTTVPRNGTGLTNPAFFNWEINAEQEVADRDPDAVVMAIGDNDGFNVQTADGSLYDPGEPGWETEFARRVAVVGSVLSGDGERPVYWVPPPTARDPRFNDIYASQNRAAERATKAISALRYVDIYSTLGRGRYSDSRASTAGGCSHGRPTGCTSRAREPWRPCDLSSTRWQRTSPPCGIDEARPMPLAST